MADTIVLMNYDVLVNNRMSYSPCIELGTKDSYGLEQIKIIRGEGWTELEVLAVFHTPGGAAIKKTVGADGVLEVPPEATAGLAGQGKIVFVGLAEDKQRITADLAYSIRDHSGIDGDNPGTPTPDVVQQILENSNNAVRVAQAAKDAAENAHRRPRTAQIPPTRPRMLLRSLRARRQTPRQTLRLRRLLPESRRPRHRSLRRVQRPQLRLPLRRPRALARLPPRPRRRPVRLPGLPRRQRRALGLLLHPLQRRGSLPVRPRKRQAQRKTRGLRQRAPAPAHPPVQSGPRMPPRPPVMPQQRLSTRAWPRS